MTKNVSGILLLDKPAAITSNFALQKVKRLFRAKKAGHTGSLDPIATGMLPICFGEATKFSQFLLESDKTYHVVAQLGVQTTTGDSEGEVIATQPVIAIDHARLEQVLSLFRGEITQVPPMYSAIKYKGKPLYELARKGIVVERKPRRITIFSLTLEQFKNERLTLRIHCSKGTYIRTLIEEIGHKLNCGAHVISLRRLSVTPYAEASMYALDWLEKLGQQGDGRLSACLLPLETAVQIYPAVKLSTAASFYLRMGQSVRAPAPAVDSLVRLISDDSTFLGMGEVMTDGRIKPIRLISVSYLAKLKNVNSVLATA